MRYTSMVYCYYYLFLKRYSNHKTLILYLFLQNRRCFFSGLTSYILTCVLAIAASMAIHGEWLFTESGEIIMTGITQCIPFRGNVLICTWYTDGGRCATRPDQPPVHSFLDFFNHRSCHTTSTKGGLRVSTNIYHRNS